MNEAPPSNPRGPRLLRPLDDFISTEVLSGALLFASAIAALIWANSPASDSYFAFWQTDISISAGGRTLSLDLRHWVNDGLMALFFFVVGLEIKRELVEGELRDPRRAALPAIGALGGMVFPALLYLAIAGSDGDAARGWGIPMATDIAMALGIVSLLSKRVPAGLKLFLLALAIVDDIGAIAVIALFYTAELNLVSLLAAAALWVFMFSIRGKGLHWRPMHIVAALAFWLAIHESGVHATIAGVALALIAPTRPIRKPEYVDAERLADVSSVKAVQETVTIARQSVSVVEWLVHVLHPWTSYLILPLFALANAGIQISGDLVSAATTSTVTIGIIAGLVIGKTFGISIAAWIACRTGIAQRPAGTTWAQLVSVAALAGVGFTVSLFVSELAFDDPAVLEQAKMGVLAASIIAGSLGALLLSVTGRHRAPEPAP